MLLQRLALSRRFLSGFTRGPCGAVRRPIRLLPGLFRFFFCILGGILACAARLLGSLFRSFPGARRSFFGITLKPALFMRRFAVRSGALIRGALRLLRCLAVLSRALTRSVLRLLRCLAALSRALIRGALRLPRCLAVLSRALTCGVPCLLRCLAVLSRALTRGVPCLLRCLAVRSGALIRSALRLLRCLAVLSRALTRGVLRRKLQLLPAVRAELCPGYNFCAAIRTIHRSLPFPHSKRCLQVPEQPE